MPIYEYQCQACGKRTEVLQRLDEAPLAACPECGGEVKKLLSAPAFQFKGSGWYVTDYAGKKGGGASDGKSESRDGKSESKDGKTEAKDAKSSEPAKDTAAKPAPAGASSGSSGSE